MNDARVHATAWLVQLPPPGDASPSCGLLREACAELSLPIDFLAVQPGALVAFPPPAGPVVVHGRKTLLDAAQAHPVYRKAVFDDGRFTPTLYARGWGARMLNVDAATSSWTAALRAAERGPIFVRPDDDDKLFTGGVFSRDELDMVHSKLSARDRERPVVVAPPREIDAEARLFVVEGRVISGSHYRPDAERRLPKDLLDFAHEATAAWAPHDVFVLDVARADGRYSIVEANRFNGSRFYASDVTAIVAAVSRYQQRHW